MLHLLNLSTLFGAQNADLLTKLSSSLDLDSIPWTRIIITLLFCGFMLLLNSLAQHTFRKGFLHAIKHYKTIAINMGIEDSIPVLFLFDKIISYSFIVIGIIVSSKLLGLNNKELIYLFGVLGIIVSVLTQQMLTNFASGIIMLLENNIRIGDTIEIDNLISNSKTTLGIVSAIKSRCTIVTTPDGQELIIPNTTLINSSVVNLTLTQPFRRIHVPFYIQNQDHYIHLKQQILSNIKNNPLCLQIPAAPDVWITMVDAIGLRCELVVWINQRKVTTPPKAALYESILSAIFQYNESMSNNIGNSCSGRVAVAIPASENIMYSE